MLAPENLTITHGESGMPWVVFIHGLGVGKEIWESPSKARILGGLFPVTAIMREKSELKTLYHDLAARGYNLVAWSQQRPASGIQKAVGELNDVLRVLQGKKAARGFILVGHSRGGLVARKYLEAPDFPILGYVSVSTPHQGSTLARWAEFISPAVGFLKPLAKSTGGGAFGVAVRRISSFIGSVAVRELLPGSKFLSSLKRPALDCPSVSVGGTSPRLFSLMGVFTFPQGIQRLLPDKALPDELKEGKGDGLVSARSARYPYAPEHKDFPVNHMEVVFDRKARAYLLKKIASFN